MSKKSKMCLEEFTSLTDKHLNLLTQLGLSSISGLAALNVNELKVMLDTTLNRATLILKEARENLPPFEITSAKMILENDKTRSYLSTNCSVLDQLLGGRGLESGSITEVFAQYGTGKSQIAFSSIVSALLEDSSGVSGSIIVIDTEGTTSPDRILEMLKFYPHRFKGTPEELLENIIVVRPNDTSEQIAIIKLFLEGEGMGYLKYTNLKNPLRLVVIDSLTGLFRSEFLGRGTLNQRQQKLNEHLRDLYMFGLKNKVPILVTNQVISSPDPFVYGQIAVGGNIVAHASTYRISLQKRKNYRIAKMVDSSRLPSNEVVFKLGKRGVIGVDELDYTAEEYIADLKKEDQGNG
jgi:DNA repair protein RadA